MGTLSRQPGQDEAELRIDAVFNQVMSNVGLCKISEKRSVGFERWVLLVRLFESISVYGKKEAC